MNALDIVLVSVISFIVFILIFLFLVKKYTKRFFVNKRNDFLVLDKYQPKGEIVLVGDSLTDFYQISEFIPTCSIKNRGIAEDTTDDLIERIQEILLIKPSKVFLQIGINDIIQKGKKIKPNQLVNKIITIADMFSNINAIVYIISLYPINRKKMLFSPYICGKATNKIINAVNLELEKQCNEKNHEFINVHDNLCDGYGNLRQEFTLEGLHLTVLAYEEITNILKGYFR